MNSQEVKVDLSKDSFVGQIVRIGQGDDNGTTIVAKVFDNGVPPSLTGATAAFYMRLPDNKHYVRDTTNCTVSGNTITYLVDEEHCCAVAGYTDIAYFEIILNERKYSTSRFRIKVENAAHDGAKPAESWDNAIDELIKRGNEALSEYDAAEDARASAEEVRVTAEQGRVAAESTRVSNENTRTSAESTRVSAETTRNSSEAIRVSSEQDRVTAEQGRVDADAARTAAQNANNASQTANDTAQSQNDSSQLSNDSEQAQNNLDQQRNNEAAAAGYVRYLVSGEYDPTTGRPTIDASTELRMVISPNPDQSDQNNRMLEWARRNDSGTWTWELVGGTGWKPTPATTAQANSIWDDEQTVTSSNTPDVSWMSYYAIKAREWVADHFVGINTIARVSQVISSGEIQATVSNVVHKLSEKLNVADYRKALLWGEVKDEWLWGELGSTAQTTGTTTTTNLALTKPGNDATIDVADLNGNMDIIDDAVGDIGSSIAPVESTTATTNHASGDYFMLGNVLMKATAAIATGEQITTSNATPATIQSQIDTLRDSVSPLLTPCAGLSNALYDESDITSMYDSGELFANISNGSFKGIYPGQRFTALINGTNHQLLVLGCNTNRRQGDTQMTQNHIAVCPLTKFADAKMNDTNVVTGGYMGSKMYTETLPIWKAYLQATFGGHLLSCRRLLSNTVGSGVSPANTAWGNQTNGVASNWTWATSYLDLMSPDEVFGAEPNISSMYDIGESWHQMPAFAHNPELVTIRAHWWLRAVVTATSFASVNSDGYANDNYASNSLGLRPVFLLG